MAGCLILVMVDRAAIAVSLEARMPHLEFVWTLPLEMKITGNTGKVLLRRVLYRYVPKELLERPKMGFGIPHRSLVAQAPAGLAESLLDERRLAQEGFFDPVPITQNWREHCPDRQSWEYHLWNVLMFQSWLEAQTASMPPAMAKNI